MPYQKKWLLLPYNIRMFRLGSKSSPNTPTQSLRSGWSDHNLGNSTTYRSQPLMFCLFRAHPHPIFMLRDRWAGAWGGRVNESQYVWLKLNLFLIQN